MRFKFISTVSLTIVLLLPLCAQTPASDAQNVAKNPRYSYALYTYDVFHKTPEEALAEIEQNLSSKPTMQSFYLPLAAKAALEAGDDVKAQAYAEQCLNFLSTKTQLRPFGSAVYFSHFVLGRLDLEKGDVKDAKDELLKAGQTAADPVLVSFGPNMSLARELLKKGENDTVIQFLEECRIFWKGENGRIDTWEATIRNGGMPEFGQTLFL